MTDEDGVMDTADPHPDEGYVLLDYEDLWNEDRQNSARRSRSTRRVRDVQRIGIPLKRKH